MEMFLAVLLFVIGLVLIIKGGDFFVDAASWIAEVSGIPNFIIGATIVSLATTLPELLVSIMATAGGQTGIAVGNAVGSVTANTSLILAISLVFAPCVVSRKQFGLKGFLMILSSVLLFVLSLSGHLKLLPSLLLFIVLGVFVYENIASAKKEGGNVERRRIENKKEIVVNILKFIFGAAGIVVGARLLVDNGTIIAEKLGVPDSIIGVTMIAIGTSLPELTTAIIALVKKKGNLSLGNIIGANIIDMTLILPYLFCRFRRNSRGFKSGVETRYARVHIGGTCRDRSYFYFRKNKEISGNCASCYLCGVYSAAHEIFYLM